jgi:hypothetical protein
MAQRGKFVSKIDLLLVKEMKYLDPESGTVCCKKLEYRTLLLSPGYHRWARLSVAYLYRLGETTVPGT